MLRNVSALRIVPQRPHLTHAELKTRAKHLSGGRKGTLLQKTHSSVSYALKPERAAVVEPAVDLPMHVLLTENFSHTLEEFESHELLINVLNMNTEHICALQK